MKRIIDMAAGKKIGAYAIFKDNEYKGKILSHWSDSGVCTVEVYDRFDMVHNRKAGGYGYDKYTKALAGAVIDGHELCDHCGGRIDPPTEAGFPRDFTLPPGYHLANWKSETQTYHNCYKEPGLRYLEKLGYQLIFIL